MGNILLLEDDKSLNRGISFKLKKEGYNVCTAINIKEAKDVFENNKVDLIISDVGLPDGSGFDFCEEIRKISNVHIIMLTALDQEIDIVAGYDIGADDYLTKPFYLDELKARIQALLKRTGKLEDSNGLTYGNIRLNLSNKSTLVDDQPVDLIGKEFDLVVYLMQNQNVILPKEQIFDRIWGYDSDTTVTVVEVYMSKIRKKLKDTEFVNNLSTLRNVGYILR